MKNLSLYRFTALSVAISSALLWSAGCRKDSGKATSADYTITCSGTMRSFDTLVFSSDAPAASTYLWRFGDGTTATVPTPSHIYSTHGLFPVTLIINNDSSHSTVANFTIDPATWLLNGTRHWTHGYWDTNIPISTSHALNDTTFDIDVLTDSTISVWAEVLQGDDFYNSFSNRYYTTGHRGVGISYTADSVYFSYYEGTSTYYQVTYQAALH